MGGFAGGNSSAVTPPRGRGGLPVPPPPPVAPPAASAPAASGGTAVDLGAYYKNGTWKDGRFIPNSSSAGGQAPGSGVGPRSTNTAQTDPNLQALLDRYNSRFDGSNADRATSRAVGGIADAAALLTRDAQAGLAARGATGSGVAAAHIQKNITDPSLRAATSAATDIALGEQERQDRLTLGGLGIAGAAGDAARADRSLNLQQYNADAQLAAAQNQQQMAQVLAFMNMMNQM